MLDLGGDHAALHGEQLRDAVVLVAAVLEVVGAGGFGFVPADIGLGASIVIAAIGISMATRRTRWHFRFILLAAVIDVAVLLLNVLSLVTLPPTVNVPALLLAIAPLKAPPLALTAPALVVPLVVPAD